MNDVDTPETGTGRHTLPGEALVAAPVDVPYDPDAVIGEWGWLWMGEDDDCAWALVVTFEDDNGSVCVSGWSLDDPYSDITPAYLAEDWRGTPYLPLSAPACDPGAGLLVTLRLPFGASIAHSWGEPCDAADRASEAIIAALADGRKA